MLIMEWQQQSNDTIDCLMECFVYAIFEVTSDTTATYNHSRSTTHVTHLEYQCVVCDGIVMI
jgi:hypothetical protein